MEGKDKCELLRMIRADIAKANGINYKSFYCDFKFCRYGTCELCEEEAAYIEQELNKKARNGEKIKLKEIQFDSLLKHLKIQDDRRYNHPGDMWDIQGVPVGTRKSEWDVEDKFKW